MTSTSQVDNELAALKAELGTAAEVRPKQAAALPAAEQGGGGQEERRLMAISHNIKPDRGLTTGMLMTGSSSSSSTPSSSACSSSS